MIIFLNKFLSLKCNILTNQSEDSPSVCFRFQQNVMHENGMGKQPTQTYLHSHRDCITLADSYRSKLRCYSFQECAVYG